MAIPITEQREARSAPARPFLSRGRTTPFYATRCRREAALSLAVSADGIRFEKTKPDPFASPRRLRSAPLSDPKVFQDSTTGLFHMLVTGSLDDGRDGCIAQLVSRPEGLEADGNPSSFRDGSRTAGSLEWNGCLPPRGARLRISASRWAWIQPKSNRLDVLYVPDGSLHGESAHLRLLAADGGWGGDAVFRELSSTRTGRWGPGFPPEMVLRRRSCGFALRGTHGRSFEGRRGDPGSGLVKASRALVLKGLRKNARMTLRRRPEARRAHFGLCVRARAVTSEAASCASIRRRGGSSSAPPGRRHGKESGHAIQEVEAWTDPSPWRSSSRGHRRCVHRQPSDPCRRCGPRGDRLFFFAKGAEVTFDSLEVVPWRTPPSIPTTSTPSPTPTTPRPRAAWRPMEGSAPVAIVEKDGARALEMPCNFKGPGSSEPPGTSRPTRPRSRKRHQLPLPLSRSRSRLPLQPLLRERRRLVRRLLLPSVKAGWSTVSIDKEDTAIEGTPAGWGRIRTIRISPGEGRTRTRRSSSADLRVAAAMPASPSSAAIPSRKPPPRAGLGPHFHEVVTQGLKDLGLPYVLLGDLDASAETLRGKRLVILPHNPSMPDAGRRRRLGLPQGGRKDDLLLRHPLEGRLRGRHRPRSPYP